MVFNAFAYIRRCILMDVTTYFQTQREICLIHSARCQKMGVVKFFVLLVTKIMVAKFFVGSRLKNNTKGSRLRFYV